MAKNQDNASASMSGYIFQLEKALLILPDLASDEYISIEQVDDIAKHNSDGTVLLTIQAKHSISKSGTTFQDTSLALWRTLEIWITKLLEDVFNSKTKFCCSSNKEISEKSLISELLRLPFQDGIEKIEKILNVEKAKLLKAKRGGRHIYEIIRLIEFALNNRDQLKTIIDNLEIEVDNNPKDEFVNKMFLNGRNANQNNKDSCFQIFVGWIVEGCKAKWKNSQEAIFTKQDFDTKYQIILRSSSIVNAIFRDKKELSINDLNLSENYREALFVKQIQDLIWNKQAKERAINEAIIDYLYSELELKNIIDTGDYTEKDFLDFTNKCLKEWQDIADTIIIKEINDYSEEEKNIIAVNMFNRVIKEINISFNSDYSFNDNTKYIQNGSFLKLSDEPLLGWHPDWESKYMKKNNNYGI